MKRPWLLVLLLGSAISEGARAQGYSAAGVPDEFGDMESKAKTQKAEPAPTLVEAFNAPQKNQIRNQALPATRSSEHMPAIKTNSPAAPTEDPAAAMGESDKQAINGAMAKLKLAQVSAIRELANLIACPKIDPKHKPNLYSHDTQVYYFGRIFQAFKNTNLKIMNGLKTSEVNFIKSHLNEESFKKAFQQTLAPLYNSPTVKSGEQNDLSILSDASALALDAIFSDSATRFGETNAANETTKLVRDGSILNEKPGTTLKRPSPGSTEAHVQNQNKFTEFFDHYRNTSEVLYLANKRSSQLSPKGTKLCHDLDTNKLQYERWEEPKVETRVDSSTIDGAKAVEKMVAQVVKEHPDSAAKTDGIINVDALSTPSIEADVLPEVHANHLSTPNPSTEQPLAVTASSITTKEQISELGDRARVMAEFGELNALESPDIMRDGNIYSQTKEIVEIKASILQDSEKELAKLLRDYGIDTNAVSVSESDANRLIKNELKRLENSDPTKNKAITDTLHKIFQKKVERINNEVLGVYARKAKDRWKAINAKHKTFTPQQRYYLAWAANVSQTKIHTKGNLSPMVDIILAKSSTVDKLKRFDPNTLVTYNKANQDCYFCTQPYRVAEITDKRKNTDLGQEILASGDEEYSYLAQLSSSYLEELGVKNHDDMPPEVLYNLSVALNYLTANGTENTPMPDLVKERKIYSASPPTGSADVI